MRDVVTTVLDVTGLLLAAVGVGATVTGLVLGAVVLVAAGFGGVAAGLVVSGGSWLFARVQDRQEARR